MWSTGQPPLAEYSGELRGRLGDVAYEIDFATEEVSAVLSRQKGHPLLLGLDVKLRARKVARRLHRAQECVTGAAIEAVKFYREFRLQFAEVITPPKAKPKSFDFGDM